MIPIVPKTKALLLSGNSNSSMSFKKRRRLASHETDMLIKVFEKCFRPSIAVRERLSKALGLSSRAIQIWFQNRRAKLKREQEQSLTQSGGNVLLSFTPTLSNFDSATLSENANFSSGIINSFNEDDAFNSCPECQVIRQQQSSCKSEDIISLVEDCFPHLNFDITKQEIVNGWLNELVTVQQNDLNFQENDSNVLHFNAEPSIEELIKMILC